MKKIIPLIAIIIAVILVVIACNSGDDETETVNINDVVKVKTNVEADNARYATFKTTEKQASDLDTLNDWYAEYYKPARDDKTIDYMIIPYSDKKGRCTFFIGVNVYTDCKIKDGIGVIKTAKKHYRTGSHDGMLSEIE